MTQIGGYLTHEEYTSFKEYAAEFHLKPSSLANLLLVRELNLGRLARLREFVTYGAAAGNRARVTAHQPDPAMKIEFESRAGEVGLKPDQAASIVFRAELDERWLARALEALTLESN